MRVEETEIALRKLILAVANDNDEDIDPRTYIPQGIAQKQKERINKYLKDHLSEDKETLYTLSKQLQFFDLAEYCELMVSKENWPYFESYFGHKGFLQSRFSQLQTMRNTLAHNRDLTDIIIKDGEAVILWFSAVLRQHQPVAE